MDLLVSVRPLLAVVPARGGSKGLPGKNVRPLAGLPLLMHSVECARMCPSVDRVVVSTDSDAIAGLVRAHGVDVPFLRPPELAEDTTPMWPVVAHALREAERADRDQYGAVLLLDPTSPGRLPEDIVSAVRLLETSTECDGVVGVSIPEFNPYWHCVVDEGGYLRDLIPGAHKYSRRQDVPTVYRINATLYLWRREFVLRAGDWRTGRLKMHEVPESRAVHIDDLGQFELTELRLQHGLLQFPWLAPASGRKRGTA